MNRELNRKKVSSRITGSILFIIPIAIKFLLVKVKWEHNLNTTEWLIIITFIIMIFGFIMMIFPLIQLLLDRGHQKEIEFRNWLDELMLTSDFSLENE
ncbi:hypothetical protein J2T20_004216 [Paenibacillus wynnii]|nr:hypothetical protein [Paenibacillus wynnii]